MTQEFDEKGWFMVQKAYSQDRAHDVTLFIQDPQGRYAITTKHSYPPGVFRANSENERSDESFESLAKREAQNETGFDVSLKRFVLHVTLDITHERELFRWDSYVFSAATQGTRLPMAEHKDSKPATWAMDSQMEEMSRRLRETGNGGLIYRAKLSDAYLWANSHPLVLRESTEKDREKIEASPAQKDPRVANPKEYQWWTAEVHGLYAGSLGLRTHSNFLELVGLNVHPMFRGRGIGHALVDFGLDRMQQESFRRTLSSETKLAIEGGTWLLSDTPAYFMPNGFHMARTEQVPPELASHIKTKKTPNLSAMYYRL